MALLVRLIYCSLATLLSWLSLLHQQQDESIRAILKACRVPIRHPQVAGASGTDRAAGTRSVLLLV
jgi:hypothetical protein